MTVEYFSNLAMVTSVVIYFLAFCMHAVEWAAVRKVKTTAEVGAADRALVGVGAGAGTDVAVGSGSGSEQVDPSPTNDNKLTPRQRMETF
ncbi:MAG TPA: hypothetical protein VIP98_16950, partial [Microlunatus sp.]